MSSTIPSNVATPTALSDEDVSKVITEAEAALASSTDSDGRSPKSHPPSTKDAPKAQPKRSKAREATTTGVGVAGGEVARRAVEDAMDRQKVIDVMRRVATKKTAGLSDEQVLRWAMEKPGRLRTLSGHLHEVLDADDLAYLSKLTGGRTRVLTLWVTHNHKGTDGVYRAGAKATKNAAAKGAKASTKRAAAKGTKAAAKKAKPTFAQHKLSENPQAIRSAAKKVSPQVRGKTEVVVGRGAKKTAEKAVSGKMRVREAGRSVKDINRMLEKAADPNKVTKAGKQAATRMSAKAVGGSAGLSVAVSLACDAKGLYKGEKSKGEVTENAAWAAGEGALVTAATAAATAAAAPSVAAGVAALTGSAVAGTTAMAGGLALMGPVGIGIGCGIGIGFGVKKLRNKVRGS
jgi:hypothetical protein